MRAQVQQLDAMDESDPVRAAALDVAFHESIAVASANPVIQIMFGSIRTLTYGLAIRSLTDRMVRAEGLPLHAVILKAIVNRDATAAEHAMLGHLVIAETYYGEDLDRPLNEVLQQRVSELPPLSDLLATAADFGEKLV